MQLLFRLLKTVADQCGEEYWARSDPTRFASPEHPDDYPNSVTDCFTQIYAFEGQQINMYFESFDLEDSSQCSYDYLEVPC